MNEYEKAFENLNRLGVKPISLKNIHELVGRATPKKVINGECQKCGGNAWGLFATKHKFCPNCGQMLDWSNK